MRRIIFFLIIWILFGFFSGCGDSPIGEQKPDNTSKPSDSTVKPGDKVGDCKSGCGDRAYCKDGSCIACGEKQHACGESCIDLSENIDNCGACGKVCGLNMACKSGQCICDEGYVNVDKKDENGCEQESDGCIDGESMECWPEYLSEPVSGSFCRKGKKQCSEGVWGECVGMVLPKPYDPSRRGEDLNCNGQPDGNEDLDKDGVSKEEGDCCDDLVQCPFLVDMEISPEMVGLNALEVADNKVDDNCDGHVDESVYSECDDSVQGAFPHDLSESTALLFLRSMGLCLEKVDKNSKKPGLISAELVMPKGKAIYVRENKGISPNLPSVKELWPFNVLPDFSNEDRSHSILPKQGKTFAVLSSGDAKDVSRGVNSEEHVTYAYAGSQHLMASEIPMDYLHAHGGKLASSASCSFGAYLFFDMVGLKVKLRVPQNANGIGFKFRFFTREYPRYLCSRFNDFFVVLLDSKASGIPKDKNISFDKYKNPVSVNNAFFTSCVPIKCSGHECPSSMLCNMEKQECQLNKMPACVDGELGQKDVSTYSNRYDEKRQVFDRGATAWLQTRAPVVPGEEIELRFYIWDTSDSILDSTVILDDFSWEYGTVSVDTDVVN